MGTHAAMRSAVSTDQSHGAHGALGSLRDLIQPVVRVGMLKAMSTRTKTSAAAAPTRRPRYGGSDHNELAPRARAERAVAGRNTGFKLENERQCGSSVERRDDEGDNESTKTRAREERRSRLRKSANQSIVEDRQ